MNETTVENMTTIGTVYESMMRNQRTYLAKQDNKHRLEDECTDFSLNTRAVASMRQTEALASVIFFVFFKEYSKHYKHYKQIN